MISSWMNRLSRLRLTLVLTMLVLLTLLHSLLVSTLQAEVDRHLQGTWRLPTGKARLEIPAEKNAAPLYRAAWELQQSSPNPSPLRAAASVLYVPGEIEQRCQAHPEEVGRLLEGYSASLRLVDQAHLQPYCDYQLNYSQGMDMQLPNFLAMRSLAQLLVVASHQARARGDWAQANLRVSQGLRLAYRLEPNRSAIGLMIKVALANLAMDAAQSIPGEHWSDELRQECRALAQTLQQDWPLAMEGERAMVADSYARLLDGRMSLDRIFSTPGASQQDWARDGLAYTLYKVGGQPMLLLDELSYLKAFSAAIQDPQGPAPRSGFVVASDLLFNVPKARKNWARAVDRAEQLGRS